MGEVVVSYEEVKNDVVMEEERENEEKKGNHTNNKEGSSSVVRWERFLPRMALRVLLVEADDSTRQIISALLRKCSYKVASVPDGLKAWEVLKARPHNIDLILTEVELPSISGYALLTLIMEHDICKNIPVIMMSTHDSVSMVYKCMLKGAADFLVKPIRINELKNLWQHVWRRQSMSGEGLGPQDESVGQQKLEATAENNATSDHSSSSKICAPRQEERVKKGSDAQSSCRKPDLEADQSAYSADEAEEEQSQPQHQEPPTTDLKLQDHSNCGTSSQNICNPESAIAGSDTAAYNDNYTFELEGRVEEQQSCRENENLCTEAADNNRDVLASSSREVIDLIGAFDNLSKLNSYSNDGGVIKHDFSPQLDLSLRRFHPGVLESQTSHEKQMLNHSNASAFTRYVNKNGTSGSTQKDNCIAKESSSHSLPYDRKVISLPINLTKEVENECQIASQRLFPIPLPIRGTRVDVCATTSAYGSVIPPIVSTPSPSLSPNSANQQMNSFHQFGVEVFNNGRHHYHHAVDQSPRISSNQKMESLKDGTHLSPQADQSATSTFCNGNINTGNHHLNVLQDVVVPGGSENGNEPSHVTPELSRQRSIQREAALMKFRLKRKERCYEKKVRYESRKKLAEQRPRVKGQFVRQVPPDPPPQKSDNSGGNSVAI